MKTALICFIMEYEDEIYTILNMKSQQQNESQIILSEVSKELNKKGFDMELPTRLKLKTTINPDSADLQPTIAHLLTTLNLLHSKNIVNRFYISH